MSGPVVQLGAFAANAFAHGSAEIGEMSCSFAAGGWDPSRWAEVRSVRWNYENPFLQMDGHIMNRCPVGLTDAELYADHVYEVYSSMVYTKRFAAKAEISATMAFDHLMAPLIVLAPAIDRDDAGHPSYREHVEIVLFNEGFNVWRYLWKNNAPCWRKIAFLRRPMRPKTPYEVKVTLERRSGTKELTVSCGGTSFGYADDLLPETFFVGLTGCEGRCRFYDFKVKAGLPELSDAAAALADGEH